MTSLVIGIDRSINCGMLFSSPKSIIALVDKRNKPLERRAIAIKTGMRVFRGISWPLLPRTKSHLIRNGTVWS